MATRRTVQTPEERKASERASNARYYAANRERLIAAEKKRRDARRDAGPAPKGQHYLRKFGITEDDYQRMLAEQGGHCALCPKRPVNHRLHVDHNHTTGQVRRLLCAGCNRVLGYIENRPGWAEAALQYLRQHATVTEGATS